MKYNSTNILEIYKYVFTALANYEIFWYCPNYLLMKNTHAIHSCSAIVVSCMDFRLQTFIRNFAVNNLKSDNFDRLAIAGGVKNLPFILEQVELSHKLHHITDAYLINHEDCGAYGVAGSFEIHKRDLQKAKQEILKKLPSLNVIPLYLKLDGTFEKVE